MLPDPPGPPVGTGGATLEAISWMARDIHRSLGKAQAGRTLSDLFSRRRLLVVHAGGESKRIPLHAPLGKSFALLPVPAAPGQPSTLIDELLARLAMLGKTFGEGLVVASADVLLAFDRTDIQLQADGVIGVAFPAPWETGRRHGVYVPDSTGRRVAAFLQKPSLKQARAAGAIGAGGNVLVDTGIIKFDSACVAKLARLAGLALRGGRLVRAGSGARGVFIDLYEDLGAGLLPDSRQRTPAAPVEAEGQGKRRTTRAAIRDAFASIPFRLCAPPDARFLHLGTTHQYWQAVVEWWQDAGAQEARREGSYVECADVQRTAVVLNSVVLGQSGSIGGRSAIQNCSLNGPFKVAERCLVQNIADPIGQLRVRPGVVVDQVAVRGLPGARQDRARRFVTRVYGLQDNPKLSADAAVLLGEPLLEWLKTRGVPESDVWPHVTGCDRTLWNARLFPTSETGEDLPLALWMQDSHPPAGDLVLRWRAARRLSFEDTQDFTDGEFMRAEHKRRQLEALAQRSTARLIEEAPVAEILAEIQTETDRESVLARLAAAHQAETDHLLRARILKAMADIVESGPAGRQGRGRGVRIVGTILGRRRSGDPASDPGKRLAAAALREVAVAVSECLPDDMTPARFALPQGAWVRTEMAARIDFGGGWSDTPPHSLEKGGCVLNAAIRLSGEYPIRATARVIPEPVIKLRSLDQGTATTVASKQDALAYAKPGDPMAIPRAAICCTNILPRGARGSLAGILRQAGGGIEIVTESRVPQGCGLGGSSIVAAAITNSLLRLIGRKPTVRQLVSHVSIIEQMLTTGGGWQDQIGAIAPSIKLAVTRPGLEQVPSVRRLRLTPRSSKALEAQLVLAYTGRRRLAKGILQSVMGRYLSRDREVVAILSEIQRIAREMAGALVAGDLDTFGLHMGRHWQLNKILDPKSSNAYIETLMKAAAPYASGAKLAGAGGGGFMIVVARSPAHAEQARAALLPHLEPMGGYLCDFEFADPGMRVVAERPMGT